VHTDSERELCVKSRAPAVCVPEERWTSAVDATRRIREVSLDLRWLLCDRKGRKEDYLTHICATIFTVLCLAKRSENLPYTGVRKREQARAGISTAADVMFNELLVSQWTVLILECASSLVKLLGARTCVCMYPTAVGKSLSHPPLLHRNPLTTLAAER